MEVALPVTTSCFGTPTKPEKHPPQTLNDKDPIYCNFLSTSNRIVSGRSALNLPAIIDVSKDCWFIFALQTDGKTEINYVVIVHIILFYTIIGC